uniref:Uncharacterized protein n=1 Tax=Anguilla anguilla TaxID=7936 RepID=A0A0E9R5F2_ANGAN
MVSVGTATARAFPLTHALPPLGSVGGALGLQAVEAQAAVPQWQCLGKIGQTGAW